MRSGRAWAAAAAFALLVSPLAAEAQGRGKAKGANGAKGNGPSFCRSGAGHPVFGWEWCRDRGWDGSGRARNQQDDRRNDRIAYPDRTGNRRYADAAFDNGYADGYEKGLDDGRDGRRSDPTRHGWYREANRNYDPRYGSRAEYANAYRDGFRSGYEAGFADGDRNRDGDNTARRRWPLPF